MSGLPRSRQTLPTMPAAPRARRTHAAMPSPLEFEGRQTAIARVDIPTIAVATRSEELGVRSGAIWLSLAESAHHFACCWAR